MKINIKLISTLLIAITFLISFIGLANSIEFESEYDKQGNTYTIWACSDMHVGGAGHCSASEWSDVVGDGLGIGINYSICDGDLIDWPGTTEPTYEEQYDYFWNNTEQTYCWWDVIDSLTTNNVCCVVGNHDGGWGIPINNSGYDFNLTDTYDFGNIKVISVGMDFMYKYNYSCPGACNPYTDPYVPSFYNVTWLNSTIQANQDKNIIVVTHFPVDGTVTLNNYPGHNMTGDDNEYVQSMLGWLDNNSYHLDAWITGHVHNDPDPASGDIVRVEKFNVTFVDDLAISKSGKGTQDSVFFDLEEGDTQVILKAYNHGANSWYNNANYPYYFNLTYDFDPAPEDETSPQFLSIEEGTNGTTIYNSTPTINWTIVTSSQYNLQIDNNADFSSPEINLTDINKYNYPTKYSTNSTRVSFTIPDANALPSYNTYYMRVKAYKR